MNKYYPTCTAALLLLTNLCLHAQPKDAKNVLAPPPPTIKIDGKLDEWSDSLRYYNEDKKIFYTLANDKDNLYMAIRLNDRTEETRVLGAGLTLSINTKGSKKATYTLTFPVGDQNGGKGMGMMPPHAQTDGQITQEDRDEMLRARLTKLRDIKVSGFKSIEGDIITTTNTYGIRVAIDYDANGYLVYEAAIPFKLFDEFNAAKKEWAFNFKINGLTRPNQNGGEGEGGGGMRGGGGGMGGGMGGMGGGGMRGGGGGRGGMGGGGMRGGRGGMGGQGGDDRSELFKSIDFWEKYWIKAS